MFGKKRCSACRQKKSKEEFGKDKTQKDGKQIRCKVCRRKSQKAYRNSDKGKKKKSAYQASDKAKAIRAQYDRLYKLRFPNKVKARTAVFHALERGDLKRPETVKCYMRCGDYANEYHHYLGYEKKHWLDVKPVCHECHGGLT